MKPNSFAAPGRFLASRNRHPRGFALVISLSLMVLLTVLAVGLLTLSTVSLRASSQSDAMQMARANARMALSMAIGQLQKTAGPDQRITAPAAIASEDTPTGFAGAWKAWARGEEGTDYDSKDQKFLGWLASSSLGVTAPDPDTPPHVSPETAGAALLLGEGTLQDRPTDSGQDARMAVKPTIVEGSSLNGRFAWATIDESMKSRLNLDEEEDFPSPAREILHVGGPGTDGVQALEGLEDFEATASNVARMITNGSADLQLGKDKFGKLTPDLTVWSASLMTNPVEGGLKRDLSSLFSRGLSSSEKTTRIFNDAGLPTGDGDPYLGNLASYHNLYDKIGDTIGGVRADANGLAASVPTGYDPAPYDPRSRTYLPKPQALKEPILAPSVLRVDIIFSLVTRDVHGGRAAGLRAAGRPYMLHLMYLPVVTLHNPYNVPLTFDSLKLTFQDIPIGFQFMVDGQPLTNNLVPLNGLYNASNGASTTTKNFGITLKSAVGSTGSQPIRLLPGQTKLFGTPKVPPSWKWADESPGAGADGVALFDWNLGRNFTSDFNMAPTLIAPPTTSCGFDVDWLAPPPMQTPAGVVCASVDKGGIVSLKGTEQVGVKYGPFAPTVANNAFSIVTELRTGGRLVKTGAVRINYESKNRLEEIVEEGTSLRFPDTRSFPEIYPKLPDDPAVTVTSLYQSNNDPVSNYERPDPFVVFSVSGKTTKESFVPNRPFADGSPAIPLIGKVDFSAGKDAAGDVPLEMIMMPIRGGSMAIEEIRGTQEGFFFGGHGRNNGMPRATFFEVPQVPMQSLAQLRHANLGVTGFHPNVTYTVGESLASPLIGTDKTKKTWPSDGSEMLDKIWLSNAAMWDRYYFSTIAPQNGSAFGSQQKTVANVVSEFLSGESKLLNRRLSPVTPGDTDEAASVLTGNDGWLVAAAYMLEKGGFNVNSLSVESWTSVLSALRGADVSTYAGIENGNNDTHPFPRVRRPADLGIDEAAADVDRRWQGFRSLTEPQVRTLAENLVKEIRERGPFLSLSEFVNRRLGGSGDELALRGAVQSAIMESDLNDLMGADGLELNAGNIGNHKYISANAAFGNNAVFAPGSLSQGDVMSVIGSHVTVRGDTFAIRCYGDAIDKEDGKILARAWCEAVVQRMPQFIDPSDPEETATAQLKEANAAFGRRFEVLSFRWLAPDEV
jgi:hypothetical protein